MKQSSLTIHDAPLSSRNNVDAFIAGGIFILAYLVFSLSPIHQLTDSNYSMLLSENLLHHRSFQLDHYAIPRLTPTWHDNNFKNGAMYQIELIGPHLYYYFPPGSSILSIPYVAWMNLFGVTATNLDNSYNPEGETRIQAGLAALLMAGLATVFFFTARLLLPLRWSIVISLGAAFGTQLWSTASRALWTDTWAIFLLGIGIYVVLANALCRRKLNPVLLASLLACVYLVRPTNSIAVVAISLYVFLFRRDQFLALAGTGFFWVGTLIGYSFYHFHQLLPNYFLPGRLSFSSFWTAFTGNLISPSRGLLVYVPVLFFIGFLLVRYRKAAPQPRLILLALTVICLHLIIIAGFTPWNGGFSYGPRYTTGLVPWFFLLTILSFRGLWETPGAKQQWRIRTTLSAGVVLLVLSIFLNARGAISYETWMWNIWPTSVDKVPAKIWDWRQPQFLAGLVRPPEPATFPYLGERVKFGVPESDAYAWYGWSWGEGSFRWSDGKEAALVFGLAKREEGNLVMRLGAFVVPGKLNQQNLEVYINDKPIQKLVLTEEASKEYSVNLAGDLLHDKNILVFKLPNATSPQSLGVGSDQRRLGIRLESFEFRPQNVRYALACR